MSIQYGVISALRYSMRLCALLVSLRCNNLRRIYFQSKRETSQSGPALYCAVLLCFAYCRAQWQWYELVQLAKGASSEP